ncbi:MAG: type II toxin-antitoxin system VapC family toxin [Chloroflexi bacterium]|nr:type II toxin-antitoxin system VapC family toxin [Chloroflexota bacterium]
MEHAIVVDANVVVKIYIAEEFSDLAEALIIHTLDAGQTLYAPFHFRSEVINTIHKQQYQGRITADEADEAVNEFIQLPVILTSSDELYQRAVRFSRENGISAIYDSLYAVLAETLGVEFWTNDRRFIRQAGSSASWIRWLGDYRESEPGNADVQT